MNNNCNTYASIILLLYLVAVSSSWSLFSENNEILFRNSSRIKRQASCGDDFFQCQSGECISSDKECDGPADCADGSDETDACKRIRCMPFSFTCKYGACINKDFECDGKKDCRDNSDEETSNPRCKRSSACSSDQFQCKNGQCIDDFDRCDGKKNCADGSDETAETCLPIDCPAYAFRCAYGACVQSNAWCNKVEECADGSDETNCGGTRPTSRPPKPTPTPTPPVTPPVIIPTPTGGGCILPPHPANGELKVLSSQAYNYVPYSPIHEYANIRLDCRNGYVPESDNPLAVCSLGQWTVNLSKPGVCIRTCPSIKPETDSYTVKCIYNNNEVSCKKPKEGTRADVTCKTFFEYTANRPFIKCKDGLWNYVIAPCTPECGRKRVGVQTLIIGGGEALKGEYPWLVGIYYSSNRTHLCGGSIISRYYVLSAAHCFATTRGVPFDKNDYLIAAGKNYRDLDDTRDADKQIVKIGQLYIPQDYRGIDQNYASDYAILKLQNPFVPSPVVQPVCVDWNNNYEAVDFTENNKGVVAGWGYTQQGSDPAEELKKLTVPFRQRSTCEEFMPKEFVAKYYTHDKFCAGFINNETSVCSGDSGGGLYFRNYEFRFFVRGIVSLAPTRQTGCDSNQFALYTKVSRHLSEIEEITGREV